MLPKVWTRREEGGEALPTEAECQEDVYLFIYLFVCLYVYFIYLFY